jgi:hypothetical protein
MILTSALIIWNGLIVVTGSESPVVVVLSESMEPGFRRVQIPSSHNTIISIPLPCFTFYVHCACYFSSLSFGAMACHGTGKIVTNNLNFSNLCTIQIFGCLFFQQYTNFIRNLYNFHSHIYAICCWN